MRNSIKIICLLILIYTGSSCKQELINIQIEKSEFLNNVEIVWLDIPVPVSVPIQSQTHPSIVYSLEKWNGYSYWLCTTPYPKANAYYENICIYFSNNIDNSFPINFLSISNNPITITPVNGFNSDPDLYFKEGKLHCTSRSGKYTPTGNTYQILDQYSMDGQNWSQPLEIINSFETSGKDLLSPSVITTDKETMIYLLNGDIHNNPTNTARNTFFERISFSLNDKNIIKRIEKSFLLNSDILKIYAWHFDLFEYKNKLYMIFCGKDYNQATYNKYNLYLAVSTDYLNFNIYKTPLLTNRAVYRPSAFVDKNNDLVLFVSVTDRYEIGDGRSIGIIKTNFPNLLLEIK